MSSDTWTKSSWKNFPALQQPTWPDQGAVERTLNHLSTLPPLVFAGEIRSLKKMLAKAVTGDAFLLQGGDCSESFAHVQAPNIRETLKVLLVSQDNSQNPVLLIPRRLTV